MAFTISSPDFKNGDTIPKRYTCEGDDMSPELSWTDPPGGTKSYALVVEDPDAPAGTFIHWIVYDLPEGFHKLYRGIGNDTVAQDGIKQGSTDFGHTGWGGPCPPKGHGQHRYNFILRALDLKTLGLSDGATRKEVEDAMNGHILGEARIMGLYRR